MKTTHGSLILIFLLALSACSNQEIHNTTAEDAQPPQHFSEAPSTAASNPTEHAPGRSRSADLHDYRAPTQPVAPNAKDKRSMAAPPPSYKPSIPSSGAKIDAYRAPPMPDRTMAMEQSAAPPPAQMQQRYAPYAMPPMPAPNPYMQGLAEDREQYARINENPLKIVDDAPVSTFSIDVDTGSYANVRRMLNAGRLPPADAVRVEELINYFPYNYTLPRGNAPFSVHTEIAPAPWNPDHHLLRIGIKAQDLAKATLPPANLVFLVDVSGSMMSQEKLPLLKSALHMLVQQLRPQDCVSLVTYASGSQVVLYPTSGANRRAIDDALSRLQAGGSTYGEGGIRLAYQMAKRGYIRGGINRILLATDGDFNVGMTNFEALKNLIEEKRQSGVSLSTLGFGVGNYNDHLMEQLADAGNGNYSYIDTLNEGRKVLVNEMTSTLATIAKDVKIQIEFNPDQVSEYRLIGYENRMLKREDFNNDKVDAGEVGSGHTVTALYELTLNGQHGSVDPLRYGRRTPAHHGRSGELAFLRLRYKAPNSDTSRLVEWPLHRSAVKHSFGQATPAFRFAAAVAAFGQQLRGGQYTGNMNYAVIARLAAASRGSDPYGYRGEFLRLVRQAQALSSQAPGRYDSLPDIGVD